MHTRSFTNPQFLKISLTHKKFPSGVANCRNVPFAGERRRGSRVRFPKEERCAESPPTFICGKRRKTRRKPVIKNIPDSGVVFTFEEGISTSYVCLKGQQPIFQNCGNCVILTFSSFYFLRSTKAGLLLLRTLHRRGNQTYVVLSLKVNQAILLLERWSLKGVGPLKMIHLLGNKNWDIELFKSFFSDLFCGRAWLGRLILALVSL